MYVVTQHDCTGVTNELWQSVSASVSVTVIHLPPPLPSPLHLHIHQQQPLKMSSSLFYKIHLAGGEQLGDDTDIMSLEVSDMCWRRNVSSWIKSRDQLRSSLVYTGKTFSTSLKQIFPRFSLFWIWTFPWFYFLPVLHLNWNAWQYEPVAVNQVYTQQYLCIEL